MTDKAEALKPCPREPDEAMLAIVDMTKPPVGPPEYLTEEFCERWRKRMRKGARLQWIAMYDAAPKSLEIPREIAALRELVRLKDLKEAATKVGDAFESTMRGRMGILSPEYSRMIGEYEDNKEAAWAAARSALAMYDQERG